MIIIGKKREREIFPSSTAQLKIFLHDMQQNHEVATLVVKKVFERIRKGGEHGCTNMGEHRNWC